MFGGLKSSLKQRLKGVVEDIKGRRVDEAEAYVPVSRASRSTEYEPPAPVARAVLTPEPPAQVARAVLPPEPPAAGARAVLPPEPPPAPPAPEPVQGAADAAVVSAVPVAVVESPPSPAPVSVASLAAAAAAGKVAGKAIHADTGSTDLEAYLARAKANGRDASVIRGGTGVNTADDGAAYWGPVDNDSSRAKAAGKLLSIDQFECISCGTCVEQTDKVYVLPDDGKASPIAQDGPMDLIQDAIDACPVTCIAWVAPHEAEERGLATGIPTE